MSGRVWYMRQRAPGCICPAAAWIGYDGVSDEGYGVFVKSAASNEVYLVMDAYNDQILTEPDPSLWVNHNVLYHFNSGTLSWDYRPFTTVAGGVGLCWRPLGVALNETLLYIAVRDQIVKWTNTGGFSSERVAGGLNGEFRNLYLIDDVRKWGHMSRLDIDTSGYPTITIQTFDWEWHFYPPPPPGGAYAWLLQHQTHSEPAGYAMTGGPHYGAMYDAQHVWAADQSYGVNRGTIWRYDFLNNLVTNDTDPSTWDHSNAPRIYWAASDQIVFGALGEGDPGYAIVRGAGGWGIVDLNPYLPALLQNGQLRGGDGLYVDTDAGIAFVVLVGESTGVGGDGHSRPVVAQYAGSSITPQWNNLIPATWLHDETCYDSAGLYSVSCTGETEIWVAGWARCSADQPANQVLVLRGTRPNTMTNVWTWVDRSPPRIPTP